MILALMMKFKKIDKELYEIKAIFVINIINLKTDQPGLITIKAETRMKTTKKDSTYDNTLYVLFSTLSIISKILLVISLQGLHRFSLFYSSNRI